MTVVTIDLNGVTISAEVEPRETLADFLRDACGLTATHLGCEHGACGACTVAVDDQATRSCLSLAIMCDGRSVFTLEGLRNDPVMEVLRKYFHERHALQCGFCTPGMLMMARDILRRIPNPGAQTVRHELSGQICRCTGYAGIVNAIVAAGEELARAAEPELPQVEEPAEAHEPAEGHEPIVEPAESDEPAAAAGSSETHEFPEAVEQAQPVQPAEAIAPMDATEPTDDTPRT